MARTPDRAEVVRGAVEALHEPRYLAEQLVAALQAKGFAVELVTRARSLSEAIEVAARR